MPVISRINCNHSLFRNISIIASLFIYITFFLGTDALGQYQATISFQWSKIDSTVKRISIGNSSDFYWYEPMPIRQYIDIRAENGDNIEWKINLRAPIQQVQIYIIGRTFNLLLADGDRFDLKIMMQKGKTSMELDVDAIYKKRILFFEALNTYFTSLNFSSNTIKQKQKDEVYPYLIDIKIKAQDFVENYFNNENKIYRTVANEHIESVILNNQFYLDSTIILPKWVLLNDSSTVIAKLSAVTELMKNYGNKLYCSFDIHKDTAILSQNSEGLKKPYRDYSLIVALDKILTERPNALSKATVEKLLGNIEDSTYQLFTSKMLAKNFMLGKPIPDSVSTLTYLLPLKSTRAISFTEILSNNEEEMVIVDFWASWCGACRLDMQNAVATKQYLDSLKIKVVYLSCDREKDRSKWIDASKVEGVTINQFLIKDDFSSPLIKYLNVNYIPRYILFKDGKLVDILFPRLTDVSLKDVKKVIEKIRTEK